MSRRFTVTHLDHIVLACPDVERSLSWWSGVLGLAAMRVEEWRRGELPFPSVRVNEHTIIDLVPGEASPGRLVHVCLVVEPTDLAALAASGELDVIEGPVTRSGARGDGTSLYIRDPDGTTVELRHY